MALSDCIYSRIRGPGGDHGTLNLFSLCARICVPRPKVKRPEVASLRSQAMLAIAMGLLKNEIAMPVANETVLVEVAATPKGRKGSCFNSVINKPS